MITLTKHVPAGCAWKTRVTYNNEKLFSHFLIGFHKRFSDVVSYPLPIEYWHLLEHVEEIDKEPYNTFRENQDTEKILNI